MMAIYEQETLGILDFQGLRVIAVPEVLGWRERLRILFGGRPHLRVYSDMSRDGREFPFIFGAIPTRKGC